MAAFEQKLLGGHVREVSVVVRLLVPTHPPCTSLDLSSGLDKVLAGGSSEQQDKMISDGDTGSLSHSTWQG